MGGKVPTVHSEALRTSRYGPSASQEGDLYLPNAVRPPVVCLLHGGFWRMPYARDETGAIARDLVHQGYALWNLEYRRVGEPGGGWPGTLQDVAAGIDHLADLAVQGADLDLTRVIVAGHSAGGHLAIWSGAHPPAAGPLFRPPRVRPAAVAGLAAILDLHRIFSLDAGTGAVAGLLGGPPDRFSDRYAAASPMALLPLGVRQLILHGSRDEALPIESARDYATAAKTAGDDIEFVELPGGGHMDFVDPGSEAHRILCRWLARVAPPTEAGR